MSYLDTSELPIDPELLSLDNANQAAQAEADEEEVYKDDEVPEEASDLSSGSESAYEEEEDLDAPLKRASGKRGPGRPRKHPVDDEERMPARRRGKAKAKKGKGKDRAWPEDEDDVFDRLVGYVGRVPRGGSVIPNGGVLHPEEEAEEGFESTKKARRPRRARAQHKPTHEVTQLLAKSNLDYISGNCQQAIDGFLEVIRLDPYIYGAWSSLGTLYEEEGNADAARQMKFCGLHIEGDAEGWRDLAMSYKGAGKSEECLYCLRKALVKDPQDIMALWEISAQYKAIGKMSRALDAYKKILRYDSDTAHDFAFLADLQPAIIETKQTRFGADILRTAFDWHIQTFTGPDDTSSSESSSMTLESILNLTDLLLELDDLEDAVVTIRRGQRWLQGRGHQKQWDFLEDDREYDAQGVVREEEKDQLPDEEQISFPLDISLRHRLAVIRLKLGNDNEAKLHVEELLHLDVEAYKDMFIELGNALMVREQWETALECFGKIQESDDIDDTPDTILAIGLCHYHMKNSAPALEALQWVTEQQPSNLDARLKLANVLEDIGRKEEALEIVSDVLRIRAQEAAGWRGRGPNIDRPRQTKADKQASQKLNKKVLEEQMREQMHAFWDDIQQAEAALEEGEPGALDRFMYAAGTMIENFRLAKSNFGKNRGVYRVSKRKSTRQDLASKAAEMQDRLERTLGFDDDAPREEEEELGDDGEKYKVVRQTEFYGLGNEDWLTLVVKYCCVLMVKNEDELAMEILEHVMWAGLFNNRRAETALRLTIVACAMRTKSWAVITDHCKRLAQSHQFRAEPFLLMLGCMGGGGVNAHAAWQSHALQKFIHRELRLYDYSVKGQKFHYSVSARRWAHEVKLGLSDRLGDEVPVDEDDDEEEEDPEEGERPRKGKKAVAWRRGTRIAIEKPTVAMEDEDEDVEPEREETPIFAPLDPALSEVPVRPTKGSPVWNWLHGTWMLTSKSYQSALFYLMRAYEYDQYNPLLCFNLAQATFGRAMNRQADNRNYFIGQGMAFLARYRKLSNMDDPVAAEEVEYNFGRAFHNIGVLHLAVKHYEKVLASVEARMAEFDEIEDRDTIRTSSLALEAAHNLMLLYGTNGSMRLVQERSKWLAI